MVKPIALAAFFSSLILLVVQFFTPFFADKLPIILFVVSVIVLGVSIYAFVVCKTKEEGRWFAIAAIVLAISALILPFVMLLFVKQTFAETTISSQ